MAVVALVGSICGRCHVVGGFRSSSLAFARWWLGWVQRSSGFCWVRFAELRVFFGFDGVVVSSAEL